MSRKIILIKQELLLLVYELNRSGLLAENEKIRPILAQLEKLLLCDLSPSTNDSGLTPSQLYVFMPPNLGGFFMVRSYYPSECHADYFDFERIEALKPAIEACGISTLSQSPMLGFHKQMDNRIKLLEEILSFRMQGVEFDNGDMYVDGHKAASDVRDEFVSVTEKLMDELA